MAWGRSAALWPAMSRRRAGLELVGAVDVDPAKAGRDAGDVIALGHPLGFAVTGTLAQTLARTKADIVTHCTSSYFDRFQPQIIEILGAGLDIVSTAEELSFPWLDHAEGGAAIDAAARARQARPSWRPASIRAFSWTRCRST